MYSFEFLESNEVEGTTWRPVNKIQNVKIEDIPDYVDAEFPSYQSDTKSLIRRNLGKFLQRFRLDSKLLLQEVEEVLPYDDVLEVFVRVNSGGIKLTKSDLVFSTVVLNSPDMEASFNELVHTLNGSTLDGSGDFDFDIDWLIKTCFVLLDFGAKYDVSKLKSGDFVSGLDGHFAVIEKALLSTLHFLKNDCKIHSKRFLRSDLALIPIVDFIFRQPHQQIPDSEISKLRQYLYMSFFLSFYSYGADGKIDVIHKMIDGSGNKFLISSIGEFISERTKTPFAFSERLLSDTVLVLNIIQDGVSEIPKKRGLEP
jgi:hypothetical protein